MKANKNFCIWVVGFGWKPEKQNNGCRDEVGLPKKSHRRFRMKNVEQLCRCNIRLNLQKEDDLKWHGWWKQGICKVKIQKNNKKGTPRKTLYTIVASILKRKGITWAHARGLARNRNGQKQSVSANVTVW